MPAFVPRLSQQSDASEPTTGNQRGKLLAGKGYGTLKHSLPQPEISSCSDLSRTSKRVKPLIGRCRWRDIDTRVQEPCHLPSKTWITHIAQAKGRRYESRRQSNFHLCTVTVALSLAFQDPGIPALSHRRLRGKSFAKIPDLRDPGPSSSDPSPYRTQLPLIVLLPGFEINSQRCNGIFQHTSSSCIVR